MRLSFVALLFLFSSVSGRGRFRFYVGGHHYPHSRGYSGYGNHRAPVHTYPSSTGLSGHSNRAPVRQSVHQQHNTAQYNYSPKTEVHHHYHYSPPQQINYGSAYHPVYQGHPPVYVYEYRDSGSRFDTLLAGLALYNLGRNIHSHHYDPNRQYNGVSDEICKLGISRPNGEYEETRIDCMLVSSFIWEDTSHSTLQNQQRVTAQNTTVIKETVTTNGTGNTNGNSSVTVVTTKSETVIVDALKAIGPSIAVSPGMMCYMIRTYRYTTTMRKPVDCALLQEYARRSLHSNAAHISMSLITVLFNFLIHVLIY